MNKAQGSPELQHASERLPHHIAIPAVVMPPLRINSLKTRLRHRVAQQLFQASMPIVAVDGTMRKRLRDSPAAGHARMKTGTLSNVVAVAGYVRDALGQQCVVVAMINNDKVGDGKGRAVLDALVDWVARLGNEPVVVAQ